MMKKALVIGINDYKVGNKLSGCVNDADSIEEILETNGDSTHNFDIKKLIDAEADKNNIISSVHELFNEASDIALLFFSGHGSDDASDGSIISADSEKIKFKELMNIVNVSKAKYKIVILDCCYSGQMGQYHQIGDMTILSNNTVILTACSPCECAIDDGKAKHGTFTKLLLGALNGGASDVLGRITAGSIYSYIDQALGAWEQRPYFKANVSSFAPIRTVEPKINLSELKKGLALFNLEDDEYRLNPSYEETNFKHNKLHKAIKPYANEDHISIMKILQKMNRNGLVVPSTEDCMYNAAMQSSSAKLTSLGKHYWNLYKLKRI